MFYYIFIDWWPINSPKCLVSVYIEKFSLCFSNRCSSKTNILVMLNCKSNHIISHRETSFMTQMGRRQKYFFLNESIYDISHLNYILSRYKNVFMILISRCLKLNPSKY